MKTKDKNKENSIEEKSEIIEKDLAENTSEQKITESNDYDFIREKIRKRPVNKKRVIKKMLITAGSAVLFSTIACISFLFLEPVLGKLINNDSNKDAELNKVILNETAQDEEHDNPEIEIDDTPYEETPIEKLNYDDEELVHETVSENTVSENSTVYITEKVSMDLDEYQYLHRQLYSLANEVTKSMVTVTSISQDVDVLNDSYYSANRTSGVIFAEGPNSIYILANAGNINGAEQYIVTFYSGDSCSSEVKAIDKDTDLAILAIKKRFIPNDIKDRYTIATLGSSNLKNLVGSVVIAVGDPIGVGESVSYGMITSNVLSINVTDASYQIITTDMTGNKNSNGVLINARGQVIGFITNNCHDECVENVICAYGISGIKSLIEKLSNGGHLAYTGIHFTSVTPDAKDTLLIPGNVYVTKVEAGSPASISGIMPGDIILSINGESIGNTDNYMKIIDMINPGDEMTIEFCRLSGGRYEDLSVSFATAEK